jgi:cytochrome c-type biogenesis protein CcmH/NrfG
MKEKDYTQAVEAYKDALRNKPSDEETRYNYALKKMLKENPPKDDKRIRIKKGQRQKRSGQERQR